MKETVKHSLFIYFPCIIQAALYPLFIKMIQYKGEEVGIQVVVLEEAYTSKCSALDWEEIGKHDSYVGKRVKRGLFKTKVGRLMNADVNGSLNILRLGLISRFEISSSIFNPVKMMNINKICDVSRNGNQRIEGECSVQIGSRLLKNFNEIE